MVVDRKKKEKKYWVRKLKNKYKLVIMNADTYEEKLSFLLSRLNVLILGGSIVIFLIILTTFVIAFTPLREYIPGYTDVSLQREVLRLRQKVDSLEIDFARKNLFLNNLRAILEGKEIVVDSSSGLGEGIPDTQETGYFRSIEDSILRSEYDRDAAFSLYYPENEEYVLSRVSHLGSLFFFLPLEGVITNEFNAGAKHFGIDIVAKDNEAVKATLDGTVIFADWTVATGYTISIQHQDNFISVYKHNSVLLKSEGSYVKAGEPIAIVGNSGELSTGPHLHFELWYKGAPVNPRDYIAF
ncbi:MAG: M23 family metallopeptidase [Bacteroidales bacterium]|nr:M23 family metallopeptidase [Bacteroidales bacterium]